MSGERRPHRATGRRSGPALRDDGNAWEFELPLITGGFGYGGFPDLNIHDGLSEVPTAEVVQLPHERRTHERHTGIAAD